MPARKYGLALLDDFELGIPDQRAIGENPERIRPVLRHDLMGHGCDFVFGVIAGARLRAGIRQGAFCQGNKFGRQVHAVPLMVLKPPPEGWHSRQSAQGGPRGL